MLTKKPLKRVAIQCITKVLMSVKTTPATARNRSQKELQYPPWLNDK